MVEAVEHVLCHESFTSSQCSDGGFDRRDLTGEPVLLLTQPREVALEGALFGGLARQHLGDLRQPEPELAQQQDALQPHERGLVVVAGSRCAPTLDGGSSPMSS